MPRKKTFQTFREAKKLGPYAELPLLPEDIQVQLFLSRNDRPQPFYTVCEKDSLLLLMSGTGAVRFQGTSVDRFGLRPGDCVYVPAGAPHRFETEVETVVLRFKSDEPGLEAASWYCESCDAELYRETWDAAGAVAQERYQAASTAFNADATLRTCAKCGTVHPATDLAPYRWDEVAAQVRAG